jgi:hypothetical protein
LIVDDDKMTKNDLQRWAGAAIGGSLAGATVAWVAAEGQYGWDLSLEWIDSPHSHLAVAGWSTLSCLVALKSDDDLDQSKLRDLLMRVEKEIHDAPGPVRYAMNGFVISAGGYVKELTPVARETGKRIGKVSADLGRNQCKIPSVVESLEKMEKRGVIGRKRKTVKC